MSPQQPPVHDVGQNQQASSKLIQLLGTVIPLLIAVISGVIAISQTRLQIQIPISTTQTAEARQPVIAISTPTSVIHTAVPSSTNSTVISGTENVDVILNNTNTNTSSIHLVIKQDDEVIANLILPPGGTVPRISLPPGHYQVEARPSFPAITPQSENCHIQWQLGELYKRDFIVTSGQAVIQFQQFDFEPKEICLTGTPLSQTPSPIQ